MAIWSLEAGLELSTVGKTTGLISSPGSTLSDQLMLT
jgi:hypothetical protein